VRGLLRARVLLPFWGCDLAALIYCRSQHFNDWLILALFLPLLPLAVIIGAMFVVLVVEQDQN
jgi:hypothetical protein